jgi:hypothetical protein
MYIVYVILVVIPYDFRFQLIIIIVWINGVEMKRVAILIKQGRRS